MSVTDTSPSSFLYRLERVLRQSEGILHQQVHTVGMIGGIIEIRTPSAQVFRTHLHIGSDIPKQVRYEILSIAVRRRFVGGVSVFRIKA